MTDSRPLWSRTWTCTWDDGERLECRSLSRLLWTMHCPSWWRRVLNAIEDFRYELPCLRHGHEWFDLDSVEGWRDGRECERCGKFEVVA